MMTINLLISDSVTSHLDVDEQISFLLANALTFWTCLDLESMSIPETSLSLGSTTISDHYDSNADGLNINGKII